MVDKKNKLLNTVALFVGVIIAFIVFCLSYTLVKDYMNRQKSIVLANSGLAAGVETSESKTGLKLNKSMMDNYFQRVNIEFLGFYYPPKCFDTLGKRMSQKINNLYPCQKGSKNQTWLYNKHTGRLMSSSANCLMVTDSGVFLSACSKYTTDQWILPSLPIDSKQKSVKGLVNFGRRCFSVAVNEMEKSCHSLRFYRCGLKWWDKIWTIYQNWAITYLD